MQHDWNEEENMRIDQIGVALRTAFERHRHYIQIRRELEAFQDRELAELGMSRYDIHDIARQATESVAADAIPAATQAGMRPRLRPAA